MWQVVYLDPILREKSGRARRIRKHFAAKEDAEAEVQRLQKTIMTEGTAGARFGLAERADAIAARNLLDRENFSDWTLLSIIDTFVKAQKAATGPANEKLETLIDAFIADKTDAEGCSERTTTNLKNRIEAWRARGAPDIGKFTLLSQVTRDYLEPLRTREGVSPQTRRNDINALSSFCSWLIDKKKITVHPLKGLRRPRVPIGAKATFTAEQCGALLRAASDYLDGKWLGTIAVMLFVGVRPSEIEETRLFYGRHPMARIEGGKLRGRANRTIPLMTAAAAWLRAAGNPDRVAPINAKARQRLCERAGVEWSGDVTRHTFISNRVTLVKDDAAVAREAGTSVEVIYRHYHRLTMPPEARRWAALRPAKTALTQGADRGKVAT